MPQQFLEFPIVYCVVGVYRLAHDPLLRNPVWEACKKSFLRYGAPLSLAACLVSYPFTYFYVNWFLAKTAYMSNIQDARRLGMSVKNYTVLLLLLEQASVLLAFLLKRQLGRARKHAYDQTIKSRGKDASFWQPYIEEWQRPPYERVSRAREKKGFYDKLTNPFVRFIIIRVLIAPLDFVPFLGTTIFAAIQSLTMCHTLLRPYFAAKGMTEEQVEIFMAERKWETRSLGFMAALLERLPLIGLVFSVSNRVGIAMWAHDLEKRQHGFRDGTLKPTKVHVSKETGNNALSRAQAESGMSSSSTAPGAFPSSKPSGSAFDNETLFED